MQEVQEHIEVMQRLEESTSAILKEMTHGEGRVLDVLWALRRERIKDLAEYLRLKADEAKASGSTLEDEHLIQLLRQEGVAEWLIEEGKKDDLLAVLADSWLASQIRRRLSLPEMLKLVGS